MKLTADIEHNQVVLKVPTTDKDFKEFRLPKMNVHYWYPFNINFSYKYSSSKDYMYLVKEKGYTGDNHYKVDVLKKTKPLDKRGGVMFHPYVYKRNKKIISRAKELNIPVITDSFNLEIVEDGFAQIGVLIHTLKNRVEDRVSDKYGLDLYKYEPKPLNEEWDKDIFEVMTEDERFFLLELGEIYSMLTVMRKLSEEE